MHSEQLIEELYHFVSYHVCLVMKNKYVMLSKGTFSVISVAVRVILKHWKTGKSPQVKEWVSMMNEMSFCECMLYKLNDRDGTTTPIWESFGSYITLTGSQQSDR